MRTLRGGKGFFLKVLVERQGLMSLDECPESLLVARLSQWWEGECLDSKLL